MCMGPNNGDLFQFIMLHLELWKVLANRILLLTSEQRMEKSLRFYQEQ